MPSALTYPGVYVEEISSGVRTITGVATSVTAPLPVLRRGAEDRGVTAQAGSVIPVLTGLFRNGGTTPFTTGFAGDEVEIRVSSAPWAQANGCHPLPLRGKDQL